MPDLIDANTAKGRYITAIRLKDRERARLARCALNAAVIASHITDRTLKGGITAAEAVALKSLLDMAVTVR